MILKFPCESKVISLDFGIDSSTDSSLAGFYTLFDNKHPGVDFDLPEGTDIFAAFEGIVVRVENHIGMGNTIGIRNGNILSLYAHLSEFKVGLGQVVYEGDLIAKSGNTGKATTSPHLHFELRDLRFKVLKDMVIKPEFETKISNYQANFSYKVNNSNTPKNLNFISKMYFGTENFADKIKTLNKLHIKNDEILNQDQEILIPNYS